MVSEAVVGHVADQPAHLELRPLQLGGPRVVVDVVGAAIVVSSLLPTLWKTSSARVVRS